jgi:hypothetical protein
MCVGGGLPVFWLVQCFRVTAESDKAKHRIFFMKFINITVSQDD